VVFALSGTVFAGNALERISRAFEAHPAAEAVYGDIEIATGDGRVWPLALSAFDYERLIEQGSGAQLFAMTRAAALRAVDAGAADLYRLLNSMFDGKGDDRLTGRMVHIPAPLGQLQSLNLTAHSLALEAATSSHLKTRGIASDITPSTGGVLPAVRVSRRHRRMSTTIVIPVRNKQPLLQACLESIAEAATAAAADIMIVDNDSSELDMRDYLAQLAKSGTFVVSVPGPFNFARLNNIAAEKSDSELLCLLNNDILARDSQWLREMQSRIAESDVGAVGALLSWPNGVVQHGGVVLGPNFAATHAFNDRIDTDPGYGDLLRVAHECSAVTAACLLTRRSDFIAVGGMDEVRFPVNFNDVDYCLKLRGIGKRIVFTPHARLFHLESASRGADRSPEKAARFDRELRNLRSKWGEYLVRDPYYNPALSLDPVPFSALAWPPRDRTPRINQLPTPVSVPPGF
jgi:GT2 family glycosyltransferase